MISGTDRPDWQIEGRTWPHHDKSRFVNAAGLRWHVQEMGDPASPTILLLHGTGASTHSFAGLMPLLAKKLRVIAVDLPGHGFTSNADSKNASLHGMSASIGTLLEALEYNPDYGLGHSAGVAVLLEMTAENRLAPKRLFGINSAIEPIRGDSIFSPFAKVMFLNPFSAGLFSITSKMTPVISNLLKATGSNLSEVQRGYYRTLLAHSGHVNGALAMMANWDLYELRKKLGEINVPVTLIASEDDPMVPAQDSRTSCTRLRAAEFISVSTGGHLIHETHPETIAKHVMERIA